MPGDIAILKLSSPIRFSFGQTEPGCLNLERIGSYSNELMASGWGATSAAYQDPNGKRKWTTKFETNTFSCLGEKHTGELSETLKKAYFYQDNTNCRDFLICINSKNDDSACHGDSVIKEN